ncbi:TonB-dependent receptor [Luteimonas terricola]|uniref:TonB-dependent receptor n=1 Tax=Luteimonas terricola TaxID=645597 RepID=A0ABQ2EI20_9GAMM|nr:TonB-dependent receptor [Luteimonas terricola]GGK12419.1 TonB-dependent receptor [Luteimonas terricola]
MTVKTTKLRDAITFALVSGATALAGTGVAFAQDSSEQQATTLDRIEVTGSRIKRAEIEGPNPITVISRADMDAAGEISVADFLRNSVYNSFGSTREASGSSTGSQATISLRGLGSSYTLVLLDGRRMTTSGALNGAAANINMIPTSAVERIEILREGAGAVYGSDAIGGVVNVILRKDYEGMTISGGVESPKVGPNGNYASVAGGISSDRGNVTFVLDHMEREMMYNRDIKGIVTGAGLAWGLSTFNSAANIFIPGRGIVSAPNCDSFENSVMQANGTCGFDHGATSANESSMNRNAMLLNGNYDITDNTSLFFRALASNTDSLGVYASAPVDTFPTISADNPHNPHGADGTLYYRFTPLGTRDSLRADTFREYSVGLRGIVDMFGGADWQLTAGHGESNQSSVNYNYGIGSVLQELIDSGDYNPFIPTHPSVTAAAPLVGHTVYVESKQRTFTVDGNIGFDLFDIGDRPVGFVTGFEYRDDRFLQLYDAQSAAGNVFGSAGAPGGGERAYYAAYFESLFPILDTFSVTLAGRYDSYNDVGSKFSPRVSMEFRPIDSLLVRGSWGKGFKAPSMANLYGASSTTNLNSPPVPSAGLAGGDALACAALRTARTNTGDATYNPYPVDPCLTEGQYQWLVTSNSNLKPEESKNWGLGVVWSPTDAMSFALDYYDIELENVISNVPRALAFQFGDEGRPSYGVTRTPGFLAPDGTTMMPGVPQQILLPIDNGALQTVRGIDLEASYRLDTEAMGTFNTRLAVSHMLEYNFTPILSPTQEQIGDPGQPENRAQLSLGWDSGDWSAVAIGNYIGDSGEITTNAAGARVNRRLPSWTTWDLQGSVKLPWNAKVAMGVRNVGNKMPPFNASLYGFPYYDNTLYNIWGRTPYIRYEQNF